MALLGVFDAAVPLRWETDDGREGFEVSRIPLKSGMVYFYDLRGPVFRIDSPEEVRWWTFQRYKTGAVVRTTRILKGGRYIYVIPSLGVPNVVDCSGPEHRGCEVGQCPQVAQAALDMLNG